MTADSIMAWSSLRASPHAPKTAMTALELDGYLTGVVVTPQAAPIRPSAWMDRIWGAAGPVYHDEAWINAALGAAALHHNTLLRDIDRGLDRLEAEGIVDYRPLFLSGDGKPSHDAVRSWVKGFWKAMGLAPGVWSKLAQDERTKVLIEPFMVFVDLGEPASDKPPDDLDDQFDEDVLLIPRMILVLRKLARIREERGHATPLARQAKVGRNDPCPCGSGQKYKRCCGDA